MTRGRTARLSKRTVDAIEPPESGFTRVWDTELKGFHVRVRPNGRKTYEFRYRVGRKQNTLTIGDHGTFTAEQARSEAVEHKRLARRGEDPLAARRALRQAVTLKELIERYIQEAPADLPNKRASSWATDAAYLRHHAIPLLGSKPARDIGASDLARWQRDVAAGKTAGVRSSGNRRQVEVADFALDDIVDTASAARIVGMSERRLASIRQDGSGPPHHKRMATAIVGTGDRAFARATHRVVYRVGDLVEWASTRRTRRDSSVRGGKGCAARAMAALSAMMSWAVSHEYLDENPARRVKKLPGGSRERFLTADEATALWSQIATMAEGGALRELDADLFRVLALTGARCGEILGLRWSEIDFDRGLVVLPPERHKTGAKGKSRVIQLNAAAAEVLRKRQRTVTGNNARLRRVVPFVFPSSDGKAPMNHPKRAWARLVEAAGLTDFRMHDLRHTYASLLVAEGVPLAIIGKSLGHAQASTTQRYSHLKDEAAQRASDHVGAIYTPRKADRPG